MTRPEAALGPAGAARLDDYVSRRLAREPVARILGEREFWGLRFELSPETLVPRPDTETVVRAALGAGPRPCRRAGILDLGTGSGCMLVALLHELPNAYGLGIDRSFAALATARLNAARNGVGRRAAFLSCDWAAPLAGSFDLIVSNPPYIASRDLPRSIPRCGSTIPCSPSTAARTASTPTGRFFGPPAGCCGSRRPGGRDRLRSGGRASQVAEEARLRMEPRSTISAATPGRRCSASHERGRACRAAA